MMTGNMIKTTFKSQNYLEIRFWDTNLSYYFLIMLLIAFLMPPLIIPVQFNLLVSIYYITLLSISFHKYSSWSSSHQILIFDYKKNQIIISGGKNSTKISIFPLGRLEKIDFLINDHEEENLDQLIQNIPLENRIINIHLQFLDDFSFYFITKNSTTIFEWYELRDTINNFIKHTKNNLI